MRADVTMDFDTLQDRVTSIIFQSKMREKPCSLFGVKNSSGPEWNLPYHTIGSPLHHSGPQSFSRWFAGHVTVFSHRPPHSTGKLRYVEVPARVEIEEREDILTGKSLSKKGEESQAPTPLSAL